jgi:hypothetical protein
MKNPEPIEWPNDRDSKKHFLLSENRNSLPFKVVPISILTNNGIKLVEEFRPTKGEFLGGGVMKSKQWEEYASQIPKCLEIHNRMKMQASMLSYSDVAKLSTQITSEWIAFEFALVISITSYGYIAHMKWDDIHQIKFKMKSLFGSSTAEITFQTRDGKSLITRSIQSSKINLESLKIIAGACKVSVS